MTLSLASADGAGGGGGGGALLLDVGSVSAVTLSVSGGLGGSVDNGSFGTDSCFGPGGGGGAGVIWFSGSTIPSVTNEITGNSSGTTTGSACSGTSNGAAPGTDGDILTGLVFPEEEKTYEISVIDVRGCSLIETVTVSVISTTTDAFAYPDSIVIGLQTVQLIADTVGNEFFIWYPDLFLSDPTIFNPVAMPEDTMTYCVIATGYNGCVDTACVDILVVIPEPAVHIPNAFTPNGDGLNDTWDLITHECYEIEVVRVWNRWGMLVYDFNADGGKPWNGTYKGQPQAMETYLYYIKALCSERTEEEEYVGNVTLIR